ncbi:hypothetical protein H0O02_02365 [Candidatus Micrarchaeota archaeon]|nr:hypothetical protein [Candidatus Micrarchaeota archaeon]
MEQIIKESERMFKLLDETKTAVEKVVKYKSHPKYVAEYEKSRRELIAAIKIVLAKMRMIENEDLASKTKTLEQYLKEFLTEKRYESKRPVIAQMEMFRTDLKITLEGVKIKPRIFEIPVSIPMTEARIDLEEAISDYDNGCFISALVLCRRSYEGALVEAYKDIEKREPVKELNCKNCKAIIRKEAYLGIANLHDWAISKRLVNDRLKSFGFLVSELGSGGAHPPMKEFPRDREIAKLTIASVIALLNDLYLNLAKQEKK